MEAFLAKHGPKEKLPPTGGGAATWASFCERAAVWVFYLSLALGALVFLPDYFYDGFEVPKVIVVQAGAGTVCFLALCAAALRGRLRLEVPLVLLPLVFTAAVAVLSVAWSLNRGLALERLCHLGSLVLFCFFALRLYRTRPVEHPLYFIVILSMLVSAWALALDWIEPLRKWVYPRFIEEASRGGKGFGYYREMISTQGNPNYLLHILVLSVPAALGGLIHRLVTGRGGSGSRLANWLITAALAGSFGVPLICFFKAQNRSSLVSLALALAVFAALTAFFNRGQLLQSFRSCRRLLPGLLAGLALVVLLAGAAAIFTESGKSVSAAALGASRERIARWKSRFANLTDFENIDVYSRVVFLETSAAMIADDPLLGKGIGQFAVWFPGYKTPKHWDRFPLMKAPIIRWSEISPFAHNDYLQVFVELGAFAFTAFLLFWVLLAWLVLKSLRRSAGDPRFFLLLGMSAGIAGTLFNALFTFPLETVTSGLFFWTMTGLVLALCSRLAPEGGLRESGRVLSPGAAGGAALILAAALLLAACLWGSARLLRSQYLFFDGLKNHALDLDYSIRRISRAAGLNPYHFEFHYVQGLLDQYAGDEAGARASFEKAARMSPYFPEPYKYLSSYYFQDGDYRRAEACLRRYEKIYPYGVTTELNHLLGLICLQDTSKDRLSEADSLLCRAGNFQALLSLAQASYARGRLSRALELMPRVAALTSPQQDLQRCLRVLDFYGSLALEAGDTATARRQFGAVLETIAQYAPGGHPELKRRAEEIVEELDELGK